MDEEGKELRWSHQMGLHVCLELMHVLFEHTPLHEQGPMHNIIVLMKARYDLQLILNIMRN
jgi:hypothetical protein